MKHPCGFVQCCFFIMLPCLPCRKLLFTFRQICDIFSNVKYNGRVIVESSLTDQKSYNCIDLLKFCCAILVCIIHITPFPTDLFEAAETLNIILQKYICRLAVPFFFVSSGFFLFRKTEPYNPDKNRIKDYCFKLLRIFGIWSILLCTDTVNHLWYLKALLFAVVLLSLMLHRKIRLSSILLIAIPLYIIGLLGDSYYGLTQHLRGFAAIDFVIEKYGQIFSTTRNGLFMGFIFVLIGALFAFKKISMKPKTACIGFAVSMALMLAEVFLIEHYSLSKSTNMYIFLVPSTIFLFGTASAIKLKDRKIYGKLRVMSMLIYYSHFLMKTFAAQVFSLIEESYGKDLSDWLLVATLVCVTASAALVEHLSRKEKFKWLKWLYS